MIGDKIHIRKEYFETASSILQIIESTMPFSDGKKYVLAVGGESGSGKSVTALCLQKKLQEKNIASMILHQDDYFFFAPKTNHEKRMADIQWVGTQEVQLPVLQQHITDFRNSKEFLVKPIVDYHENIILEETMHISPYQILILEGTYCLSLENIDYKIFMDRTYHETYEQRRIRKREKPDALIEKVLEIEHQIIRPLKEKANIIVEKNYSVTVTISKKIMSDK